MAFSSVSVISTVSRLFGIQHATGRCVGAELPPKISQTGASIWSRSSPIGIPSSSIGPATGEAYGHGAVATPMQGGGESMDGHDHSGDDGDEPGPAPSP